MARTPKAGEVWLPRRTDGEDARIDLVNTRGVTFTNLPELIVWTKPTAWFLSHYKPPPVST
jgi:hypothetical protein